MLTDLRPGEFWNLTFRELSLYFEAFSEKRKEQMDYDISIAWYNAYFQRVNKMPALKDVIRRRVTQTDKDMFEQIKAMNLRLNGEVK